MIRPFDLTDLFLVHRLQRRGVWLDPHRALAGCEPPAWTALSAPFRWWGGDVVTYVSREAAGGAIQMRLRPGRPEADIVFLAPALAGDEESAALWRRLLAHCAQQAGEQGVQRLFASIPEETPETLTLFRQMGFSPYTREEVYGAEHPAGPAAAPGSHQVRPLTSADGWALPKLHAAITPRLVQQAEGLGGSPEGDPSLPWSAAGHWERFVLEREGEIAGLVLVHPGRSAHCLRLWGDFQATEEPLALLERGLAVLSAYPPRPVYCLVREYQSGVRTPLGECGFRPVATWSRLVKHTVVRVREPARRALPALEARAEPSVPGAVPTRR
ncbi:MAG: hypothetical protein H8D78_09290 [Chloroflexi bacterium]|nr:hypothetical protein [Chloroflexota bacterium]